MKIVIKSKKEKLWLWIWFPTRLICNRPMAYLISKGVSMAPDMQISADKIQQLFQVIRKSKKKMKNQYLVEVESKEGDIVKIKL